MKDNALINIFKQIKPFGFAGLSIYDVTIFFIKGLQEGAITTRASSLAFNFFLAFFPSIIVFFTLIPYIPLDGFQETLMEILSNILPPSTNAVTFETLDDIINDSFIRLSVDQNTAASSSSIRTKVLNIFKKYFDLIQLGGNVETGNISRDILNIDGVISIDTVNGDNVTPNLSFIVWNPDYRLEDNLIQTQDYNLQDFEFAYFYEISNIPSKIAIQRL